MSVQSGQLILLSDEATKNVTYECQLNDQLHVGSDKDSVNVCLSGLKGLALSIYIDKFGRACINIHMKRIQINGKRVPKNAVRPLVNNTAIEAGGHKFIWKYDSKCSRSYSLSPSKAKDRNVDMFIRNHKTINCFTVGSLNDENAATIDAKGEEEANNSKKTEPMPAIKGEIPENVKNLTNKRTSLIPVKPNRTSELRRSIIRSKSVSHEPIPFQCKTPKRPVPSATMAKSVNAIIRSESRLDDSQPLQATRKSLGANVNFPKIIDGMNLFNVVTNEMKAAGPSKYNSAKFSATNSPKRTPKKALVKPKRLSLRSELTEMAIMKTNAVSSEDQKQSEENVAMPQTTPETVPCTPDANVKYLRTPEAAAALEGCSEEIAAHTSTHDANATATSTQYTNAQDTNAQDTNAQDTNAQDTNAQDTNATFTSTPDTDASLPSTPRAEIVDLNKSEPIEEESTKISLVERDGTAPIDAPVTDTEIINSPESKQQCQPSRLTSSSSVEILEDSAEFCLIADEDTDDESTDSEFSIVTVDDDSEVVESETSPDIVASTLTRMKSESLVNDTSITTDTGCEEIEQPVEPHQNASEKSVSESRLLSISTPTKVLPIRARRSSRFCSLDECCSPSTAFTTPTKSKLSNNVASTPRSILKTPKASKTPKKIVRILEPTLHEEEDDVPVTNGQSADAQTSVTDQCQNEIATEPLQMSAEANGVLPESNSMDEHDEVFTPIKIKTESNNSLKAKCTTESDSEIVLATETKISTPLSLPKVCLGTPMVVQGPELIETPVEVVAQIVIDTPAEAELCDDATESVDQAANVSDRHTADEVNATEEDSIKKEETNLFDETFEIQSDSEIASQSIDPIQSTSVIDEQGHIDDIQGVTELLKTPKPLDKTNLVGMKELLQTPYDELGMPDDMRGVKEILNTPKPLDKTNLVGMKELLNTPNPLDKTNLVGMKELLNTPNPLDKTNLVGMKELLQTPSDGFNVLDDIRGVKELLNTPKPLDKTNLVGMKELLNTPDAFNESADMRGVRDLLKTPKMLDRTDFNGVEELLKTPPNQDDSHLDGVHDLRESPIVPAEQNQANQPADKKFCLNLRYNSRNSLINLVNNHMLIVGLPIVTEEELLPVPPMAEQAAIEPMAEQAAIEPIAEQAAIKPIAKQAAIEPIAEQAAIEPIAEQAAIEPEEVLAHQEEPLVKNVDLNEEAEASESENDLSFFSRLVASKPGSEPQMSKDNIVEEVEAKGEQTVTDAKPKIIAGEGKSTGAESNQPAHPTTESENGETPSAIELQESAVEVTTKPSKATRSVAAKVEVSKTPSKTRKRKASAMESQDEKVSENADVTEAVASKPVAKTPSRTRKRKGTVVEVPELQDETVSESDEASEAKKPANSKAESKAAKTPSGTRKRKGTVVEVPEPQDETVSESDEASEAKKPANSKAESKAAKTPSGTRKRKGTVVEVPEPQDETVSESDEASEAKKPANSKAESKAAKTPRRTRKRKGTVVEVPEPQDETVSESDEASEAKKPANSKAESKAAKTPSRTRKRKGTEVEVPESQDEKVSENDGSTKPGAVRTRKRNASVPVNYQASEAGRRRKASQVEPVQAEDEIEPSNELTVPKKTRARQMSAVEPPESNENVGTKVAKSRKRKASSSENSRSAKVTKSAASSSSFESKHPKKRQREASESPDDIVSETSQATEAAESEPSVVEAAATKARKQTLRQDLPPKATRSTRAALTVEPAPEEMERPTRATSKRTRNMSKSVPIENTEFSPEKQSRTKKVDPKTTEADSPDVVVTSSSSAATMSKAAKNTRSRKASGVETANTSHESTSSTATRSTRRGQTIKAAAPVAEKRPKRGAK